MQVQCKILKQYDSIAELSGRMLQAARRNDWDAVVAEEKRCRALVNAIESGGAPALSANEQSQKLVIIRKLLADDAEIRNLAQPWLQHLENVLSSSGNSRKLDTSYGGQT